MRKLPKSSACVALVAQLYPNRASEVASLAESSEDFVSMCEDYKLATETLRALLIQNLPQDEERRTDYRKLIADLERELSEALGDFQK